MRSKRLANPPLRVGADQGNAVIFSVTRQEFGEPHVGPAVEGRGTLATGIVACKEGLFPCLSGLLPILLRVVPLANVGLLLSYIILNKK